MISNIKNVIDYYETYIERLKSEKKELENKVISLENKLKKFKVYGADDCKNHDTYKRCAMRVTLFIANDYCIHCDPKNYEEIK